jgi:hypothetical protein
MKFLNHRTIKEMNEDTPSDEELFACYLDDATWLHRSPDVCIPKWMSKAEAWASWRDEFAGFLRWSRVPTKGWL